MKKKGLLLKIVYPIHFCVSLDYTILCMDDESAW